MELEQFYEGKEWYAYQYFGAHIVSEGTMFRVYAPSAWKVAVIGSFNNWHDQWMENNGRGGVFSLRIAEAKKGDLYKFRIYHHDGTSVDKADPYGFYMELRPCSASIIVDRNDFSFTDSEWMSRRTKNYHTPMNIYEMHFGSWKANGDRWYRYEEMAEVLIPYLKAEGYNYVEILPLNEHPLDASWGYQSTGFFSPTSRYGEPSGLKRFINACHEAGIGVILDFVLVHFAVDDYGLSLFDGTRLYEMPDADITYSQWGSCNFAHGKGIVSSFLKSCANYWLCEFHFDGLRMDAISNIIYWGGQEQNGVNEQAVAFIQSLNQGLHQLHPTAMLIAEDSTNYLKVTAPVEYGGLGFDYKWDLGFMHDTLLFFSYPIEERKRHYWDLWFSMHYYKNELYLLPFSHDEVVHGKKTILDKMYGSYEEKFQQCRAMMLYMICHPGKKLNFMGTEIGQFREWAEYRPQDFDVLSAYPMHQMFARFFRDLNHIYLAHPALYEQEYNLDCFTYVEANAGDALVYAFMRHVSSEKLLIVLNFSDVQYTSYRLSIDGNHRLYEIMNTNWEIYGGSLREEKSLVKVMNSSCWISILPYSGQIYIVE